MGKNRDDSKMRLGAWVVSSGEIAWLAKAKHAGITVDRLAVEHAPAFAGDPTAFLEAAGGNERLGAQLRNRVKKCPACNKPNVRSAMVLVSFR